MILRIVPEPYTLGHFPGDTVVESASVQETRAGSQGWEHPLEKEGHGNSLQCSWLGNLMDRGTWQARVQGVAKESDMT